MQPFDLAGLTACSLHDRPSKVTLGDLGRPVLQNATVTDWLESLPPQFAGRDIRRLRDRLIQSQRDHKWVAVAVGGHVIKTGCGPYLIDWIRSGVIQSISMNGSAAIHDFELAFAGKTSEDVAAQLRIGRFGTARETADAIAEASRRVGGLGRGLGKVIADWGCPHRDVSVAHAAYEADIPCTVHVALGTDIVHMHPQIDGAALGEASLYDFRLLCSVVSQLAGGVWMNLGSAVVMPEVFLKAVAVVKNFGVELGDLLCVNFDKQEKYRTQMNVLDRPGSAGIQIIGHHEILIPLLHAAVAAAAPSLKKGAA